MQIPAEKWYPAIEKRRSRRQYNQEPIPEAIWRQLAIFIKDLNREIGGARAVLVDEAPSSIFKGAIGPYGKVKGAPAYVALIGDMSESMVQETIGYLGECIILEATVYDLATCWIGGFFRPKAVAGQVPLFGQERILAVSPLGYASSDYTWEEKILSGFGNAFKRKSLDSLCTGLEPEKWPEWMTPALEAARQAPSAVNRQPWKFVLDEHSVTIQIDEEANNHDISKRLDCGIAMLHLEVGARYAGAEGYWEPLTGQAVAKYTVE